MQEVSDEQLVRDGLAAWNRGDWETAIGMLSPDVEWRLAQEIFDIPQVAHGHEGVIAFWRKWIEIWDEINIHLERTVPFDDGVAAYVRWPARGRDGVEVDHPILFAFTIRDGLTTHFTGYWDRADGIKALGLQQPG